MQLLFDFLPIIAFFVAYKLADIYVATGVIIVASILQVTVHWFWKRRVNPMHLVSSGLVLRFRRHDAPDPRQGVHHVEADRRQLAFRRGVPVEPLAPGQRPAVDPAHVRARPAGEIELAEPLWRRLNWMWIAFFLLMGAANLVVFRNFDENTWVNFKLWGMLGLTLAFIVVQGFWIASRPSPMTSPRAERIKTMLEQRVCRGPGHRGGRQRAACRARRAPATAPGTFSFAWSHRNSAGRSRLERHRLVYEALAQMLPREIHALNIVAVSPDDDFPSRTQ